MSQSSQSIRRRGRKRGSLKSSEEDTSRSPVGPRTKQSNWGRNNSVLVPTTPQKIVEQTNTSGLVTRSQTSGSTEKENNPKHYRDTIQKWTVIPSSRKRFPFATEVDVESAAVNSTSVDAANRQSKTLRNNNLTKDSNSEVNKQELGMDEIQLSLEQENEKETQEQSGAETAEERNDCTFLERPPQTKSKQKGKSLNKDIDKNTDKNRKKKSENETKRKVVENRNSIKHRRRRNDLVSALSGAMEQTKVNSSIRRKAIVDFMKEQNENKETPSGVIKKIKLFNFMCHDNFEKEWHPNVNFVTGENGSGKSSILNGIILGLGARAAVTSRTKSIKSLVKVGKSCAKIEITLGNYGILNTELYGEEFTIQRIIDHNGTSSYKIQIHGKYRPLRKTELDNLLLTLGIQLDNPVTILNQETARSFLKSKDPRDKYGLFYSGTQLDKCNLTIKETSQNLQVTNTHLNNQVKIMHLHREELLKLENLMKLIHEVEEIANALSKLEREHLWASVIATEKSKSQIERKLRAFDETLTKLKAKHTDSLETRRQLMETTPEDVEKNELRTEIRKTEAEIENLRLDILTTRKAIIEAGAIIRSAKGSIQAETKFIQDLEITIENLKSQGVEMAERAKREFESKMQELVDEKSRLNQEICTLRNDSDQFRHGAEACMNEMHELQDQSRVLSHQLGGKKQDVELLRRSTTNNRYSPYGHQMQELVAKIQANASRFKELPRGPLGACFTVKDEKWVCIIEHILHNHLFNFVVGTCQSDKNLLNQLIQQTYGNNVSVGRGARRPDVYIKLFESQPLDISRGNTSLEDHPTILDAIEIENNDFIVRNALVDFARIERILLFDTNIIGVQVLSNRGRPDFPRNCIKGFSRDFYQIHPAPKMRADAIPRHQIKKQGVLLKSNNRAQLKNLTNEIANLEDQISKVRPALNKKRREELHFRAEFESRSNAQKQVEKQYQQVILSIDQVKRTNHKTPDISTFLEELDDKNTELSKIIQREESAQRNLEVGKLKASELAEKKSEIEGQAKVLQDRLLQLETESEDLQSKLRTLTNIISRMEKELKDTESKKGQMTTTLLKVEDELRSRTDAAKKKSPARVDTERDTDTIKSELEVLKRKVDESKKIRVEKEKLEEDLKIARKIYHDKMIDLQILFMLFTSIQSLVESHSKCFEKSRREMGNLLQGCFLGLLGPRRYKGRLIIDHERKELYYFVCADEEANANSIKVLNTNNSKVIKKHLLDYAGGLSGGERSFATICFIIAMWQVMESPFFMLDEFDVFMDAFNRKSSQAALICHAQKYQSHQFFFFTPLDLSMEPDPALSTILRLYPPVRTDDSQTIVEGITSEDEEIPGPSSGIKRLRGK